MFSGAIENSVFGQTEFLTEESSLAQGVNFEQSAFAHDINNLLMVFLGKLDIMKRQNKESQINYRHFESLKEYAEKISEMLRLFLNSSQIRETSSLGIPAIDLNTEIALNKNFFQLFTNDKMVITYELDPDSAEVVIDPQKLQWVLSNLIKNAVDSMPNGGLIKISTSHVTITVDQGQQLGICAGQYMQMSVIDHGCGITEEVLARMFEPYFSTKQKVGGSGLGMFLVREIVNAAKGGITVESQFGDGTAVKIYFPVSPGTVRRQERIIPISKEKVLMFSCAREIKILLREVTEKAGYEVILAEELGGSERQVINRLKESSVVLIDKCLSQDIIEQLMNLIQRVAPGKKVVSLSSQELAGFDISEFIVDRYFFPNPFSAFDYLDTISEIVAASNMES